MPTRRATQPEGHTGDDEARRLLAHVVYGLHVAVERHLQETLEELDLTLPLADALWHLDPANGPVSRRDLADRLRCDPSNVTFLVNRLEERRLITRARTGADRRVKALALTPSGVEVRNRLIATLAESSMFSELTSAQRRQLLGFLERCVESTHPSR
jgi:DNA-binding MarR family transcriptional regulator